MRTTKGCKVSDAQAVCLACGLCCNGAIFSDVKLVPGDDADALASLGMPVTKAHSGEPGCASAAGSWWRFLQPCAALDGCRCRIYKDRPAHCRNFECFLLKKLHDRSLSPGEALRVIRTARRRVHKVRKLLRALGDRDGKGALVDRFRLITRRLESSELDPKAAELYSQLTLAFHDLNRLINEEFYRPPLPE